MQILGHRRKVQIIDRVAGVFAISVGIICLIEAQRLYRYRMPGVLLGDDSFLNFGGLWLLITGILMQFIPLPGTGAVVWPNREKTKVIIKTSIAFLLFIFLTPYLGFPITTFIISTSFFKIILGSHSWLKSLILGILLTLICYLIFSVWIYIPFPRGLFGF